MDGIGPLYGHGFRGAHKSRGDPVNHRMARRVTTSDNRMICNHPGRDQLLDGGVVLGIARIACVYSCLDGSICRLLLPCHFITPASNTEVSSIKDDSGCFIKVRIPPVYFDNITIDQSNLPYALISVGGTASGKHQFTADFFINIDGDIIFPFCAPCRILSVY